MEAACGRNRKERWDIDIIHLLISDLMPRLRGIKFWLRFLNLAFCFSPPHPPPSNAGNLEEVADWGRFFLGYFLFGEAKESD